MKKINLLALIMSMTVAFAFFGMGCTNQEDAIPEENVDYEVALITDESLVQDGGHSEVAWNTLVEFGGTQGISHKYYKAAEPTEDAFVETIKEAINSGARIVIIDNSTMDSAAKKMQEEYPEIKFVMTDTDPYNDNGETAVDKNTVAISFSAVEAGYLAGYTAVIEEYSNIGFIGQSEDREIKEFGFGYISGAERAAADMGRRVNMQYEYCSDYSEREKVIKTTTEMYKNGIEVIFAAGGDIQDAVIEGAEISDGKVIGSITDQSAKSDKVITSAIYEIGSALEDVLKKYKDNEFPGGEVLKYTALNEGIGLAVKTNGLNKLTQNQYDSIMEEMAKGEIKLKALKNFNVKDIEANHILLVTGNNNDNDNGNAEN